MAEEDRHFLFLPIWKWDGIAGFVAMTGLIAVVLGGAWGVWELHERTEAARAQATLDLLDVWETRGYLGSFRSLDDRVAAVLAEVPEAEIAAARDNSAIRAQLYAKTAELVFEAPEAREEFDNLVYFFQRLHICVEAKLCSTEATAQFFDSPMNSFAQTFASEIEFRRRTQPDFARGLESGE